MDHKRTLTHNEKLVFYSLVHNPSMNDREISEDTGIKLSTVTAIRRRLQAADYYSTIKVPNLQKLGFELMVVGYGPLSTGVKTPGMGKLVEQAFGAPEEIFLAAHSADTAFFLAVAENYTSAKRMIESLQHVLADYEMMETWNFVFFPFELSYILNFFDCSNILEMMFDFESTPKSAVLAHHNNKMIHLTNKEKKVLKKMVESPEAPDNMIASMSGASRQGVSAMRKRFEKHDVLRTLRIPNFQKLGFEIFALAHTLFNPCVTLQERAEGIRFTTEKMPQIFTVSGNMENVLMAASKNYDEFTFFKNEILQIYRQQEFIRKEPKISLMPFSEMEFVKNHDYGPMLEKYWRD